MIANNYVNFSQFKIPNLSAKNYNIPLNKQNKGLETSLSFSGSSSVAFGSSAFLRIVKNKKNSAKNNELFPVAIKDISETKLGQKFVNGKNGFLYFLNRLKDSQPAEVKEFLFAVTNDEYQSLKFIEEVTKNPRDSKDIINMLVEKIGGENNFSEWYTHDKGYISAYQRYMGKMYEDYKYGNKTLDELIKFAPVWKLYSISDRLDKFGKIPKDLKLSVAEYEELISTIRKKIYFDRRDFEFKGIKIEFLARGCTPKTAVKATRDGKDYVIKVDNIFLDEQKEHDLLYLAYSGKIPDEYKSAIMSIPQAKYNSRIMADSIFTNAQIDWYLEQNKCNDCAKFYYYDSKTESAIYEFLSEPPKVHSNNPLEANKELSDLNSLGIFANDTSYDNFSGKKLIDIGHCSFKDLLRPMAYVHGMIIPNNCGSDLSNLAYRNFLRG